MARPSKNSPVDFDRPQTLTHGLLDRVQCPPEKAFVLLRDSEQRGLRLRITQAGGKRWQFEARVKGKLFTRSLGSWPAVPIGRAQKLAGALRALTGEGQDPRVLEQQERDKAKAEQAARDSAEALHLAQQQALRANEAARAITVGELWPMYLVQGRPKRKDGWKPRYRADLEAMARPGGAQKKRGQGVTRPGPLYPLLALPLAGVNEDALKDWYDREALSGKHQAARALMMFRGFLRWCITRPEYRSLADRSAGSAPAILENLPANTRRTDALDAAQVPGWWAGTEQLGNRTASAYLRSLLLTGARREEMAALRWEHVDFRWRKLTLADKVETRRIVPLTPYLAQLLAQLPREGPYVFASASKSGRITDARTAHAQVLQHAQVQHLTLHGLRRSYIRQGRKVAPGGVPAQMAGHAPGGVAEGYAVLSMDDLRPHAECIEAHILSLAGVQFDAQAAPGALRVVGG